MRLDRIDVRYFKLAVGNDRLGKEADNDISARCPVCGDSSTNRNSKRLHLYKKGDRTLANCFNGGCSIENRTMFTFLRDFFPNLFSGYRREQFQQNLSSLVNLEESDVFKELSESKNSENSLDHSLDHWLTSDIAPLGSNLSDSGDSNELYIETPAVTPVNLIPYLRDISEVPEAIQYVKSRKLNYEPEKYGKWYFGYQDLEIDETLYRIKNNIIIPLYHDNQMYGFYARNIHDKYFCTYMNDVNIGYKVWNLFNVDVNEEVYIFEGIFDAIASGLDNVVALMGAKIPQERLYEFKKPVFVLDNDETGLKNSLHYADNGYRVFVQPTKYKEKDMNELLKENPGLDIPELIKINIYSGIMARIEISKLL